MLRCSDAQCEAPNLPSQLYKLHTVTYGMKSSPFITMRTLRELACGEETKYPSAAQLLCSSSCGRRTGGTRRVGAQQLTKELMDLLSSAGSELRKWMSNKRELLSDISFEHLEKPHVIDYADN
ncbi:hypothetical protein EVAR_585_1 [Eumeta japonica]|uniref:Uncharacterized protein n=1 Tax=Eumeta variegata TaxID=151549 RepID=A0A4C1SE16_EUMVA|nr:hypothetical protein EVAR_585_1 [Eumeta japonica]